MRELVHAGFVPDRPLAGVMSKIGRPGGWHRFLWMGAPFAALVMAWVGRGVGLLAGVVRKPLLYFLPGFLLIAVQALIVIFHPLQWALWAGVAFVSIIGCWSGGSLRLLWKLSPGLSPRRTVFGIVVISLAVYITLAVWIVQAVSTCGDEQRYLLNAITLWQDPSSLTQHVRSFYWGRWARIFEVPVFSAKGFAWTILLPALIGGRLGVLWMLGTVGAVGVGIWCLLGRKMGFTNRQLVVGGALFAFSLPVMELSQHVYPGVMGMVGIGAMLLIPQWEVLKNLGLRLGLMGVIGGGIAFIKLRFLPLAGAGWSWGVGEGLALKTRHRMWVWVGSGLPVVGVALLMLVALEIVPGKQWFVAHGLLPGFRLPGVEVLLAALGGMLLDQQYGLVSYSPWLVLGLSSFFIFKREFPPWLWRGIFTVVGTLFGIILAWRWVQWDGGFTPPCRFLAPAFIPLGLSAAICLKKTGSRIGSVVVSVLGGASLLISFVFTIMPQWRFHRRTGINNFIGWLEQVFDTSLHRFFPSFLSMDPARILPGIWIGALIIGACLWCYFAPPRKGFRARWALGAWAGVVALLLVLVGAGRVLPTGKMEAESMLLGGRTCLYGDYFPRPVYAVLRDEGDWIGREFLWPGGKGRLRIRCFLAGEELGYAKAVVKVAIDGAKCGRVLVEESVRIYPIEVNLPAGRHCLKIVYLSGPKGAGVAIDWVVFDF